MDKLLRRREEVVITRKVGWRRGESRRNTSGIVEESEARSFFPRRNGNTGERRDRWERGVFHHEREFGAEQGIHQLKVGERAPP